MRFPKLLFILGWEDVQNSLCSNHKVYEWQETKRHGEAVSGQAIPTGRKEAIELPVSRVGKSTEVGKGCQERHSLGSLSVHLPEHI